MASPSFSLFISLFAHVFALERKLKWIVVKNHLKNGVNI